MEENKKDRRLDELEKRIRNARIEFEEEYNPKPAGNNGKNMSIGAKAGVELVGTTLGGALIGYLLDTVFNTKPVLFLVFALLGVIAAFYNIYKITNNMGTSVGLKQLHNDENKAKKP